MNYNLFPQIEYDGSFVIDNSIRIVIKQYIANNINLFFDYNVVEGERPEDIAFDYYGDSKLHWILLTVNNILDPFHDWPMDYNTFLLYLQNKYLGIKIEPNDWHSFVNEAGEEIPVPSTESERMLYGITNLDFVLNEVRFYKKDGVRIAKPNNISDQLLYQVTNKQYEEERNDNNKLIQLPLPEFITEVQRNLISILS